MTKSTKMADLDSKTDCVTSSDDEQEKPRNSIDKFPYVLINVFIIVFTLADRNRSLLLNQYLYNRLAIDVLGNATVDTTKQPCVNESQKTDADLIQSMTSSLIMKFDLTGSLLGIGANLVLGVFSVCISRKTQLLLPISGFTVRAVSIVAVAFWNLDLSWLYIGCVAEGLMGGISGIYFSVYLYVSDITPRNAKRTLGMALLEGIRGIMGSGINIASGQMIQRTTFLAPALFTAVCALTCLVMAFIMPDRKASSQKLSRELVKQSLKTVISPFVRHRDIHVRKMVITGIMAYFFAFSTIYGIDRVRLLYLMHRPFCWDAITIGWYQFGRQALFNVTIVTAVPLLLRYLPGVSIAIMGAVTSTGEYLLNAFAKSDAYLYGALGLSLGQGLPINMVRGELSRLFGVDEQGPLFACMAVLESISFAIGLLTMSIYTETVDFYAGLVFLVFAAMTFLVIICLGIFQCIFKNYNSKQNSNEKNQKAGGEDKETAVCEDAENGTGSKPCRSIIEGSMRNFEMIVEGPGSPPYTIKLNHFANANESAESNGQENSTNSLHSQKTELPVPVIEGTLKMADLEL